MSRFKTQEEKDQWIKEQQKELKQETQEFLNAIKDIPEIAKMEVIEMLKLNMEGYK